MLYSIYIWILSFWPTPAGYVEPVEDTPPEELRNTYQLCQWNIELAEQIANQVDVIRTTGSDIEFLRRLLRSEFSFPVYPVQEGVNSHYYEPFVVALQTIEQYLRGDKLPIPNEALHYQREQIVFDKLTLSDSGYLDPYFIIGGLMLTIINTCKEGIARPNLEYGITAHNRRVMTTLMRDINQFLYELEELVSV